MADFNIKISSITDNSKKIQDYIDNDGYPGKNLGFKSLHKYYSHKDAGCTDWTGIPSNGKTYFVFEMLFQLSERYGQVNALYVPDVGSYVDVIGKLVKMYTGLSINPKYGDKATMKDVHASIPFLSKYFLILEKENVRKPLTPENIWEFACDWKGADGEVINNVLIDSWKNLRHDYNGKRGDEYLDYVLSYRNELAENYNKHFHTIVHSAKTEMDDERDANGQKKRRTPNAYDIKGGGAWYDNGKNIITVDRPDKSKKTVDIHVWKTKPEDVGKQGSVIDTIELDWERGRYFEIIDGNAHRPYETIKFSKLVNPNFKFPDVQQNLFIKDDPDKDPF